MSMNNDEQLRKQYGDLITWLEDSRPNNPVVPSDFHTMMRDRLTSHGPVQPYRLLILIRASFAIGTALTVVGIILWMVLSPRPVSAAEIISRASQIAANGSDALQSYTGTSVSWVRMTMIANPDLPAKDSPLTPNSATYIWAKLPNLVRAESHGFLSAAPGPSATPISDAALDLSNVPPMGPQNALVINDGTTVWWQDLFAYTITLLPPTETHMQPIPTDYVALLSQLNAQNSNVKLVGTAHVAGRDAYMLTFTPNPDEVVWPNTAQVKIWIDTQTYFQLGQEWLDKNGLILSGWIYTAFSPNVAIAADRFVYNADTEYIVVDRRTPKDAADLALAWRQVASKSPFKVFRPDPVNVPTTLIMERPYFAVDGITATSVDQHFYSPSSDSPGLLIHEESAGTPIQPRAGTTIKIDKYEGNYYEEAGRRMINFVRDGTLIFLQCNQQVLSKDELIELARAMQIISK